MIYRGKHIALMDTSSVSFMQGLQNKGIKLDSILKDVFKETMEKFMKMKRFLGVLLSFAMMLTMMPISATPVHAAVGYDLWVGGTEVEAANPSGAGWSYNVSTHTLTLDGFNYSYSSYDSEVKSRGIIYSGNEAFTIELKGNNTINTCLECIYVGDIASPYPTDATLTVTGSGSLIAECSNNHSNTSAIYADNGAAFRSGSVSANSKGYGFFADRGDVNIESSVTSLTFMGDVKAISGKVKNEIAGKVWETADGEAKEIQASPDGQYLDEYKKAEFKGVPEYTVTFNPDNGSAVTEQKVAKGGTATKPTPDPAKDGYTFDGWYLGNTEFNFNTAIEADITLTAHWKENETPPEPKPEPTPAADDNTGFMLVMANNVTVKSGVLAKKARTKNAISVLGNRGIVTYELVSAKKAKKSCMKRFKVNMFTGQVKVKKGTGKGNYRLKVAVTDRGNYGKLGSVQIAEFRVRVK